MRILILAAGYGTRLYPLTRNIPKALIPIKGKHLLAFIMDKVEDLKKYFKIKEIVIVSNNKFYNCFLDWKKESKVKVKILNDGSNNPQQRLGAIGDICFALRPRPKDDWLIIGSDNFFDWRLRDFVHFSLKRKPYPSVGLYNLKERKDASNFGVVKMDSSKMIKEFIEKPKKPPSKKIAVCIYFFPKKSLNFLGAFMKETGRSDVTGKYIEWLISKTKIYGYMFKGRWIDIGHKKSLKIVRSWA